MAPRKKAAAKVIDTTPATAREVRLWAAENGFTVPARGRIRKEVTEAFTQATGRPVVVPSKVV